LDEGANQLENQSEERMLVLMYSQLVLALVICVLIRSATAVCGLRNRRENWMSDVEA
jgi:hypothetical protein